MSVADYATTTPPFFLACALLLSSRVHANSRHRTHFGHGSAHNVTGWSDDEGGVKGSTAGLIFMGVFFFVASSLLASA
eukprot:CAMPEP_0119286940 /NCGR_PEP_ID=MMETSP1329-20130426/34743_1 /TAXON_ID=114041 /ORGANISM="Genus nov. species nov., Strain RCC1024" /LENGTH=77 /DNA_ID=CAMNT_0007287685 /DNA_START=108 /DNA_END=338 /DNA_ORIENTATION=+